jgi:hypothetical protein
MARVIHGPQQWVMVGLITGAEVFGTLPRASAGRVAEYMNSDLGDSISLGQAATEDVEGGQEVPELTVFLRHVTYVQPWVTAELPVNIDLQVPRGRTALELMLVLRTRVNVTGTIYLPPGVGLGGMLGRAGEMFLRFGRATLTSPDGKGRPADGILVSREHMMFARRVGVRF